jgi:hypothetical protein
MGPENLSQKMIDAGPKWSVFTGGMVEVGSPGWYLNPKSDHLFTDGCR